MWRKIKIALAALGGIALAVLGFILGRRADKRNDPDRDLAGDHGAREDAGRSIGRADAEIERARAELDGRTQGIRDGIETARRTHQELERLVDEVNKGIKHEDTMDNR